MKANLGSLFHELGNNLPRYSIIQISVIPYKSTWCQIKFDPVNGRYQYKVSAFYRKRT